MNSLLFPAEWALRSSILILSGWLLLRLLRVHDSSIRLAAWTAMLCASMAIPILAMALPQMPLAIRWTMAQAAVRQPVAPAAVAPSASYDAAPKQVQAVSRQAIAVTPDRGDRIPRIDGRRGGICIYFLVAIAMLLRFCLGLLMSLRLLRRSRRTGQTAGSIEILESDRVTSPVTLGIVRPAIVLPGDWRQWDNAKLDAVLAHELSHIRRHDPAIQTLSLIHRALLWHSPLSWLLHKRVVRLAEEASDDAAIAATDDRAVYARVLLDFMQKALPGKSLAGVPMARYGSPDHRIHRILDSTGLSRGVNRWGIVTILALGAPLVFMVASAQPTNAARGKAATGPPRETTPATATAPPPAPVQAAQPRAAQLQAVKPQSAPAALPPFIPTQAPPIAQQQIQFEAVSIKPYDPVAARGRGPGRGSAPGGYCTGGPGFPDPGRFICNRITLVAFIENAYGVRPYEFVAPDWMQSESAFFDIAATIPAGATMEQVRLMEQTLLVQRFGLVVHREKKAGAVYELNLAKGGAKFGAYFKPSELPPAVGDGTPTPTLPEFMHDNQLAYDADHCPQLPAGVPGTVTAHFNVYTKDGVTKTTCEVHQQESMAKFARDLSQAVNAHVADSTGLSGNYDIKLIYTPDSADSAPIHPSSEAPAPSGQPTLLGALRDQLGLTLEKKSGSFDILVVDHCAKAPTSN